MQKVFNVAVDIGRKLPAPAFEVNTNDLKSVKLLITITNGQTLLNLTDTTVRIAIRKPDSHIIFQDCTVKDAENGQVEIILENQAYITPGTHTAEIMCYKGSEVVAVSGTFSYKSTKGIMNDEAVESKSEFTAINQKIEEAKKLLEDAAESGVGVDEQARQDIQEVSTQLAEMPKKVNGKSPDSNGNIQIDIPQVDTSNLVTKQEINSISPAQIDKNKGKFDQTYMTDELLQQIAGNTPINAVPAPKSITNDRIADNAITPRTATFINTSTNLFNKNRVKQNTSINGQGLEYTVNTRNLTVDFIPVTAGGTYTISPGNATHFVFYFDAAGNYISQTTKSGTFTLPTNVHKIKLAISNLDLNTLQLNEGSTLLPYQEGGTKFNDEVDVTVKPEAITAPIPTNKRTVLGESVKIMTKDLPNIKNRKLIFGAGNLRIMYRNGESLLTLTSPLEIDLPGEYNHIYYDLTNKVFVVYPAVANVKNAKEDFLRIGYIQYENTGSTALLKNVSIPTEYQINDVPVSVQKLNDRLLAVESGTSTSSLVLLEEVPQGYYRSTTTSDYSATDHYKDNITLDDVYSVYDSIVTNHYGTKTVLGKDTSGQHDVNLYEFKTEMPVHNHPVKRAKIIIFTSVHGEEKSSTISLRDFMHDVANNWQNNKLLEFIRFNVDLVIMPIANPHGFVNKKRKNVNGVDLNRNLSRFWDESDSTDPTNTAYKGTAPFSEKESQYMRDVILANKDATALFDYHMNGTSGQNWQDSFWHSLSGLNETSGRFNELVKVSLRNVTQITREAQRYYDVPLDSGYIGYQSKINSKMSSVANYAYGEGIPGFTIECMRKMVHETNVYSNDTLQLCTTFIGNHILNVIKVFYTND